MYTFQSTAGLASDKKAAKWEEGVQHIEFVVKLYRKQKGADSFFIHENPAHATSWALPVIRRMMVELGVDVVEADQRMFGLKTWGPTGIGWPQHASPPSS